MTAGPTTCDGYLWRVLSACAYILPGVYVCVCACGHYFCESVSVKEKLYSNGALSITKRLSVHVPFAMTSDQKQEDGTTW